MQFYSFKDFEVTDWSSGQGYFDLSLDLDTLTSDLLNESVVLSYVRIDTNKDGLWDFETQLPYSRVGSNVSTEGLVLDNATGLDFAYSLVQLKSGTQYCLQVRRDSDDQLIDIGFDASGLLDTAAIAAFCGGSDGYIQKWYDQSANAMNATSFDTIKQPLIYDGVNGIVQDGNHLALQFDGTTDLLEIGNGGVEYTGDFQILSTVNLDVYSRWLQKNGGLDYVSLSATSARVQIDGVNFQLATPNYLGTRIMHEVQRTNDSLYLSINNDALSFLGSTQDGYTAEWIKPNNAMKISAVIGLHSPLSIAKTTTLWNSVNFDLNSEDPITSVDESANSWVSPEQATIRIQTTLDWETSLASEIAEVKIAIIPAFGKQDFSGLDWVEVVALKAAFEK